MSKDLTRYAKAEPTETMVAFADFLIAEVFGGSLPDGVDEASFRTGVALGGSTRNYFQASEAWKNDPRNYLANVEANRAKRAEERLAKAREAAAKAKAREEAAVAKLEAAVAAAKAKAEALAAPAEEPTEEPAPTDSAPASGSEEPTEKPTEEPRRSRRAA
jgi:cell division septation protein DedD